MTKKIGSRLTAQQKKNISDGMKKHHAKRKEEGAENHYKVFPEDRLDIVELYNQGVVPVDTIASMYNISEKHLFSIINMLKEVDADE